jgi:hypothetical protein
LVCFNPSTAKAHTVFDISCAEHFDMLSIAE